MIKRNFLSRTGIGALKNALDAYALRQRVVAGNIANVQTPGFKSMEVSFEENLRKACALRLRPAQVPLPPGGIPIESPQSRLSRVREKKSDYFNGVNNVNIQEEMTDLAKTNLSYNMVATATRRRIDSILAAISGKHK